MLKLSFKKLFVIFFAFGSLFANANESSVPKNLPLPKANPSALEIMKNVYYVNHFYAFKNYSIGKERRDITVIVKKSKGEDPLTETVERYLNNSYNDGTIKAKDLAIFRSGKNRGLGMLITDYVDDDKSQLYLAWLPALRKIRRFAQPAHEDAWGGTAFTFGDVTLRKPMHETHTLLGKDKFIFDTGAIELSKAERRGYLRAIPEASKENVGKEVYRVKSTTKFSGWWYDYRISYVDTKTFGDYRVEYFKDGKMVKILDKSWGTIAGQKDPRALRWASWYAKDLTTDFESMAYIPETITTFNTDVDPSLWSESTLERIKR
jgi:hypothetical protein